MVVRDATDAHPEAALRGALPSTRDIRVGTSSRGDRHGDGRHERVVGALIAPRDAGRVAPFRDRASRWARCAGVCALLAACPVGCLARPATQLIVHVDTDLAQGTVLVGYHIRVTRQDDGTTISDVDYSLRPGAAPRNMLPAELGVLARDRGDPRRLDIDVTAELVDPANNFTVRAVVGFRTDHAERLDVFLASQCADPASRPTCAADETCGDGGVCVPIARPSLPDYAMDASTLDRPVVADTLDGLDATARDAASQPDGRFDAIAAEDASAADAAFDAADLGRDTAVACGVTTCALAAEAGCDLADGVAHTVSVGPAPDAFHFACATFTPGAAAFRLTLAASHTVIVTLGVPSGGSGAVEVYRGTACDATDRLLDSCATTPTVSGPRGRLRGDRTSVLPGRSNLFRLACLR